MAGCDDGGLSPADAAALAQPHLADFETFDRWARRAVQADPVFRSRESLEETVFAPIRRRDPVLAVWITRDEPDRRLVFGHLERPPKGLRWVKVRTEQLGSIDVTSAKIPDPRRRLREGEAERAVLVRREGPGSDGAKVSVTVAYALSEDG